MRKGGEPAVRVRVESWRWARKTVARVSQADLAAAAREAKGDGSISESLVALIETGRRQPSYSNAEAFRAALEQLTGHPFPLEVLVDLIDEDATEAAA